MFTLSRTVRSSYCSKAFIHLNLFFFLHAFILELGMFFSSFLTFQTFKNLLP